MKKLVLFAVLAAAGHAFAAGFRIDTQSSRATGMASAVVGLVDDASANFYNPAGLIAGGKGFEVQLGDTLIIPQLRFTGEDGTTTNSVFAVSPPPHVYLRAGLLDNVAIGVGVFTPFGAAGHWPEDWPGQFRAHESSLQTFDINPNLAYSPHPRISFGVGVNIVRGTVFIARHLDFVESQGEVNLGGGAWGVGFNGGLKVDIIEKTLAFGASLRTEVGLDFVGRAHFEGIPVEFQSRIYDQDIKAHVSLPLVAQFGLGIVPVEKLRIGLDVTYVDWSSFRELRIEFQQNDDLTVPLPKKWWDTASLHIGGEYQVSDSLAARLGFAYDPAPTPESTLTPDLPDATRVKVSAGVGYKHSSGFFADLGFQFVYLIPQRSTAPGFPGTYAGTAEVVSLTVGFKYPSGAKPASSEAADAPPADNKEEPKPDAAPKQPAEN